MVGRFVSNVSTQNWWRSQGIMIFWGTNTRVFVPPPLCSTVQRRCNGGTDVCGHLFGWVMMHLGQGMQGSHSGFNQIQKLVGGFNHLEKYEVNGKDYPIYYGKNVWNHQPESQVWYHSFTTENDVFPLAEQYVHKTCCILIILGMRLCWTCNTTCWWIGKKQNREVINQVRQNSNRQNSNYNNGMQRKCVLNPARICHWKSWSQQNLANWFDYR